MHESIASVMNAPRFATGTDYVPKDMLAYIHKGEKIIPAAENKGGSSRAINLSFGNINISGTSGNTAQTAKQLRYDIERELNRLEVLKS